MTSSKFWRLMAAVAVLAAVAVAPLTRPASAANPATSNKGGEVRGTTRADERAGNNGDQGRDRAEANKAKQQKKTTGK